MNRLYTSERLWLHYFWIVIAEFGTAILYGFTFLILRRRVKQSFYSTPATQIRAQSAAKLILAYPVVYCVCTLPIVIARLTSMGGSGESFATLCVAGAMITSNGWLDVLLYSLTRSALLSGPNNLPGEHVRAIDTFRIRPDQAYGTTTTIEATNLMKQLSSRRRAHAGSTHDSTEELCDWQGVKVQTVVQVRSETVELDMLESRGSDLDLRKTKDPIDVRNLESG